ncbi:MAG: Uma2 family endonuclease [Cyanobacteria bacterium P01_H01_bin.153]
MTFYWPPVEQTDPPRSPRETLPTMYDLPSEWPDESGLPDEFHALQPQLLSATLRLSGHSADNYFTGMDLNVYYDVRHPLWHKRPDWFLALGVPRLYDGHDMRLSYVTWQEEASPTVVVELLSPGTEADDLGQRAREPDQPPTKWQVYQDILRIPYYLIFDRYENQFRAFGLRENGYEPLEIANQRLWLPNLNAGIGVWQGTYQGITRPWLRWYDDQGHWYPTPQESFEQEHQRAEQERQRTEQAVRQIAQNLLETGMAAEQVATVTGLSLAIVQNLPSD